MEALKNDMLNMEEVSKVMALSWFVLKAPEVSGAHKGSIKDSPAANVMKGALSPGRALILADISVIRGSSPADGMSGSSLDIHALW